jgi:hypothetical protein
MLVLQLCSDPLHLLPSSSSETYATADAVCNVSNVKVEEDEDVIEEVFIAINGEADIGLKQEEVPGDITFPEIKSEPDGSYVCVYICIIVYIVPVSRNLSFFGDVSVSGQLKQLHCGEYFLRVMCGWEGLY